MRRPELFRADKKIDLHPIFTGSKECRKQARGVSMSIQHTLDELIQRVESLERAQLRIAKAANKLLKRMDAWDKEHAAPLDKALERVGKMSAAEPSQAEGDENAATQEKGDRKH